MDFGLVVLGCCGCSWLLCLSLAFAVVAVFCGCLWHLGGCAVESIPTAKAPQRSIFPIFFVTGGKTPLSLSTLHAKMTYQKRLIPKND